MIYYIHKNMKVGVPMTNKLEYKNYLCEVYFSSEDLTLYGKLLNIDANGDKWNTTGSCYLFEIENPAKADKTFADFIDTLIADGYLK